MYMLIAGNTVAGAFKTRDGAMQAIKHFAFASGIRIKKSRYRGVAAAQMRNITEARQQIPDRNRPRYLKPGEFRL